MKYADFINLDNNFIPVFDLTAEKENYWKKFIPTRNFYKLLNEVISALETNDPTKALSFFVYGTFGVGKSHSSSVIKHLICDDWDSINDFVEKIEDIQTKERLKNFRKLKKGFAVTLKGASGIYDNKTLSLTLQRTIKRFFPNLTLKTDFDTYVNIISENRLGINWNEFISNSDLKHYVKNVSDLLTKLSEYDNKIFNILQKELTNRDFIPPIKNIVEWLKEVSSELKNKKIAEYLLIFWDEATPVLDKAEPTIINELQNIAELTSNHKVYLYLISHRVIYDQNEYFQRMLDRFNKFEYSMEAITSYHLISATFSKLDSFASIKEELLKSIDNVIKKILTNNNSQDRIAKRDLENILPIHPYSAYLLTFIARNLGSTERSIFNFIFDKENGFINFIDKNPETERCKLLTADFLWDYFLNDFYRLDISKTSPSIERYNIYKVHVETLGNHAIKIFKGILLLNILYKHTSLEETSLVAPSDSNIKSMFQGEIEEQKIDNILHEIAERQYITKTVDNLYLVTSSILSNREVEEEKIRLENENKDITKILSNDNRNKIINTISSQALREINVKFYPFLSIGTLQNNLRKDFKEGPQINIAIFIAKNGDEIRNLINIVKEIAINEDFKNIVFLIIKKSLDDESLNRIIDNLARSNVASKHNYKEDAENYRKNADKVLNDWVESVLSSEVEWYLGSNIKKTTFNVFNVDLNNEISGKIFIYGLENIKSCTTNRNVWTKMSAVTAMEIFLFADNRQYIENKTNKGVERYLRGIIQDDSEEYIVDVNLNIRENFSNHPLVYISNRIREIINRESEKGAFNLGETLSFLIKPPYGIFQNRIYYSAIGFLMREYVGVFYDCGTGTKITKEVMRDKIKSLFNYFERQADLNKLVVRIGSVEENNLLDILKRIFLIEDSNSITDIKWKIREFFNKRCPLWLFFYDSNISDNELIKQAINCLNDFISKVDSEFKRDYIENLLYCIQQTEIDLKELFNKNTEEISGLFYNYIKSVLPISNMNSEVAQDFFVEIEQYISNNLQEARSVWDENRVRNLILEYWIKRTTPPPTPAPENPSNTVSPPGGEDKDKEEEKVEDVIESSKGRKVKKTIIKFLEELDDDTVKKIAISLINLKMLNSEKFLKLLEEEDID